MHIQFDFRRQRRFLRIWLLLEWQCVRTFLRKFLGLRELVRLESILGHSHQFVQEQ